MSRRPPPPRDRYEQQRERNGHFWRITLLGDVVVGLLTALARIWQR